MARQWTREELDRVHPLPDGWAWRQRPNGSWCATYAASGVRCDVWVSAGSLIAMVEGATEPLNFDPPINVALPVILASKGLDSLGAMAAAMDTEGDLNGSSWAKVAYRWCAAMLRRGTVEP
jgi:hypothetical protein